MASTVVRQVGYTGSIQELVWTEGNGVQVTAYLWGGGGGGGGNDSNRGGFGSGGGYSAHTFTVNNGDVIQIAVGGGGGAGASGRSGAAGGGGGASWIPEVIFDSRIDQPQNYTDPSGNFHPATPVYPQSNRAWCNFLNSHGVWVSPDSARNFENWYPVTLPNTGYYTYTFSCDNYANALMVRDGTFTGIFDLDWGSYTSYDQGSFHPFSAGLYWLRLTGVNTGGPGGIGFTISQDTATGYSGGGGGRAGFGGSSGGGGGGGGATVLFVNGSAIAVAGGGAGGGGGGNSGAAAGQDAPGNSGQGGTSPGQNGQDKSGDGGGGGAGGGGLYGGNGGGLRSGDQGGLAGMFGLSSGVYENPNGRNPGGITNSYYRSGISVGGTNTVQGTSGFAVFEFNVPGTYIHTDGSFTPVSKTWINNNGTWTQVQSVYVKENDAWRQVLGGSPPTFESVPGNFGVSSRPY